LFQNDVNISDLTHVNNVSTLPCETLNAHSHMLPLRWQIKDPEFIPPQLWPPNLPDLNPVDNSMWEMLQEKVYKTRITALELLQRRHWRMASVVTTNCPTLFSVAVSVRAGQIHVFCTPSLAMVLTRCNQLDSYGEFGGHSW